MPPTGQVPSAASRRFGVRTALLAVAFVLVTVPFLLLLLLVVDRSSALARLDNGASTSLHGFAVAHPLFVRLMEGFTFLGNSATWFAIFAVVVAWLLWRRLPRLAIFVAVTPALSSLLNSVVKRLVDRTRPVLPDPVSHAAGLSFPSGHAQAAMVGYGVLVLVFLPALHGWWRRVAVALAVALVLAIGFSRVALGVHYVSDVLAGYILGAAWLAVMTAAFSAWRRERGRPAVDPREGLSPEQAGRISPDKPTAGERESPE
ncbi:MAG: phosphatase PAP2 family protein [Mycobacteriales bacterium]